MQLDCDLLTFVVYDGNRLNFTHAVRGASLDLVKRKVGRSVVAVETTEYIYLSPPPRRNSLFEASSADLAERPAATTSRRHGAIQADCCCRQTRVFSFCKYRTDLKSVLSHAVSVTIHVYRRSAMHCCMSLFGDSIHCYANLIKKHNSQCINW